MSFKVSSLLLLIVALLSACSTKPGCNISGVCKDDSYKLVKLVSLEGAHLESTFIHNSKFSLSIDQDIPASFICEIYLVQSSDTTDFVTIPVGIENGNVKITYGENFKISGTPLNDKIHAFLSGLSHLRDQVTSPARTIAVSEIPNEFSHYYCKSILLNYDNPLGEYIFDRYGIHLLGDDKTQAEQSLKR